MLKISEVKKWAKEKGYTVIKDKGDEENNEPVTYYWYKTDNENVCGMESSVSKVATAVYNHMTDNKWVEYQKNYKEVQ